MGISTATTLILFQPGMWAGVVFSIDGVRRALTSKQLCGLGRLTYGMLALLCCCSVAWAGFRLVAMAGLSDTWEVTAQIGVMVYIALWCSCVCIWWPELAEARARYQRIAERQRQRHS